MVYPRMSLLCGCKRQVSHASCMQVPQTTGKPVGTRVRCSLPSFPQLHLKTWVATKVSLHLRFGLRGSSRHPPRDANNCDVWKTLVDDDSHMRLLAALNQTKCTQAPTERHCSPAEVVLVGKWVACPGFTEILKAHPPMWMWTILTKANALYTVEEGRLPQRGHTRCIDTCMCFKYLTT